MANGINVVVRPKQSDLINVIVEAKKTVLVNQSGLVARNKLSELSDVDVSNKQDGSLLIYDETQGKWVASILLEKQIINGGTF